MLARRRCRDYFGMARQAGMGRMNGAAAQAGQERVDQGREEPEQQDPTQALRDLRRSIDNIDAAVVHMLAERFRCTQAVGRLKAAHGMPPADPARETQQVARLRELARDAALDPDFAEKFLAFVIREVIRHHEAFARVSDPAA